MGRYSRFPAVNRTPEELGLPPETPAPEPESQVSAVAQPETTAAPGPSAGADISEMTTKEVLAWVGDDEDRRSYAIMVESADRGRKTLLRKLGGA